MAINGSSRDGEVVISNDVIASIAWNAAKDVEGVSAFVPKTPDPVSRMRKEDCGNKAVRVWSFDGSFRIHIYLRLKDGVNMQEVCSCVQRSVKSAVQSMTGKIVSEVHVSVQGIDFTAPDEENA